MATHIANTGIGGKSNLLTMVSKQIPGTTRVKQLLSDGAVLCLPLGMRVTAGAVGGKALHANSSKWKVAKYLQTGCLPTVLHYI